MKNLSCKLRNGNNSSQWVFKWSTVQMKTLIMNNSRKNLLIILGFLACSPLFLNCSNNSTNTDWAITLEKQLTIPEFKKDTFNINDYGAIQDSIMVNTISFKRAIDECNKNGGGVVLVPEGIWNVGPIHLKSNVNLHISSKAVVSFSQKFDDYLPIVRIQRGGIYCYNYSPFIYANGKENIAITGKGKLDGNGQVWWPWKNDQPGMAELFKMGKAGTPIEDRRFGTVEDGVRPPFVQFIKSKNVYMEGVTLLDGPSWMIHPVECTNLIFKNLTLKSHGPNNDGIDPDMSKNILIEDCILDVGDDNIAIKSGRDEEAWRIGVPSENIIVRGCTALRGHGGLVIGSEMSAGVKNVLVENCNFKKTDRGIRFKTRLGRGGYVENITIRNIKMEDINKEAIIMNMQYDGEPIEKNMNYDEDMKSSNDTPIFRNILLENIECYGAKTAISIKGLDKSTLGEIKIKNISVTSERGLYIDGAYDLKLEDIQLDVSGREPMIQISNSNNISINTENGLKTENSDEWLFVEDSRKIEINNEKY
ncbi:glycoside hydrolase family 28 protein [uncultured Kriegella sp.]|uniref:glycoside hydrolase family 28 protein n=1 Tax=uncultured Kriegella sp. TaxID=1798910 RepID=UPI0030D96BDC|tara:strand:- start:26707 stop:28308 length:1602 start_codon:yes stop_codon:yes gene_type:complete